jgi:hypothetical protein
MIISVLVKAVTRVPFQEIYQKFGFYTHFVAKIV